MKWRCENPKAKKHVFNRKPITATLAEAKEILE
jgi:predicted dehydrogenase